MLWLAAAFLEQEPIAIRDTECCQGRSKTGNATPLTA